MEDFSIDYADGSKSVKVKLTWGVHKELSKFLMEGNRLMTIFTDSEVSDTILQICLATRNEYGEAIKPFEDTNKLDFNSMIKFLEAIQANFEDFFFQNQQRLARLSKKFQDSQTIEQ